jgi:uncharacterized membrane protein
MTGLVVGAGAWETIWSIWNIVGYINKIFVKCVHNYMMWESYQNIIRTDKRTCSILKYLLAVPLRAISECVARDGGPPAESTIITC